MPPSASVATSLFADLPFSGEVNLLTTGAFAPGGLFAGDGLPRGVAYLAIGAPTPRRRLDGARGDERRGSRRRGSSPARSCRSAGRSTRTTSGLSYSTQEYQGGNPAALAAVTRRQPQRRRDLRARPLDRRARRVLRIRRALRPLRLSRSAAGCSARGPASRSSRVKGTRVTALLAQRMVAPGAEEFLSPRHRRAVAAARAHVLAARRPRPARRARALPRRALEHEFSDAYVVGVRRFFQGVDDQLVTLFGVPMPRGSAIGRALLRRRARGVDAQGWAFRLSPPTSKRVRGSIDYSRDAAAAGPRAATSASLVSGPRAGPAGASKSIHDITTSFQTDIPETATRVFVLYKINSGYMRGDSDSPSAGLDGAVRRPGEPGAAVRPRRHQVGSARRRPQPVPRSERRDVGLRRTARRPSAEAGRRRIPGPILKSRDRLTVRSAIRRGPGRARVT